MSGVKGGKPLPRVWDSAQGTCVAARPQGARDAAGIVSQGLRPCTPQGAVPLDPCLRPLHGRKGFPQNYKTERIFSVRFLLIYFWYTIRSSVLGVPSLICFSAPSGRKP